MRTDAGFYPNKFNCDSTSWLQWMKQSIIIKRNQGFLFFFNHNATFPIFQPLIIEYKNKTTQEE